MLKETYYNQYKGWGEIIPEGATTINIMRSYGSILSPSFALLNDWKDKKISWDTYTKRFIWEIENNLNAIELMKKIKELSETKDIYLVCACHNKKKQCHRFILMDMINKMEK